MRQLHIQPDRVTAIPIAIHNRLRASTDAVRAVRNRFGLGTAPYALYPANGWPHKNHRMLLVSFARLVAERPDLPLHLVLTGNLLDTGPDLATAIERIGLSSRIHLAGFVSDEELAALYTDAFCLLFPSLYEGFGIPLLEAMQFRVPIVCSAVPSLVEVAADAARYIDPRQPESIGAALHELWNDPGRRRTLIEQGVKRLNAFSEAEMVNRYLDVLDTVLRRRAELAPFVEGVFDDRWMGPVVTAVSGASGSGRVWHFEMCLPDSNPSPPRRFKATWMGGRSLLFGSNEARSANSASMCRRPVDEFGSKSPRHSFRERTAMTVS